MIRNVAAVIIGFALAFVLVVAVEGVSAVVHPFPPGFDGTEEEMVAHVANYPHWVLALVVVLWGATVFVSTWLATRIAIGRHPAPGIVVGVLLILAVGFNMYLLPYPLWFEAANLAVFPLCIYLGVRN